MTEEATKIILEQKESVKLQKMSKQYQWEIKLVGDAVGKTEIERLEFLDAELQKRWGAGVE